MTDRFRVVPAAYVLLVRGTSVLLQLRAATGYMDGWWAAGAAGHVERGESVHQAAVRETREELGVVVDPADLEPMCVLHRTASSGAPIDERVDFFFAARRWTGEPTTLEPAKVGRSGVVRPGRAARDGRPARAAGAHRLARRHVGSGARLRVRPRRGRRAGRRPERGDGMNETMIAVGDAELCVLCSPSDPAVLLIGA